MKDTARWNRSLVAVAAAAVMLVVSGVARADSLMTPATRDSAGQGADASGTEGHWTFTVADVQGRPAQVIVRLTNKATGKSYWAGDGHPTTGETLKTYDSIPAGVYDLRATIWGGPPNLDTSVTLAVDTP